MADNRRPRKRARVSPVRRSLYILEKTWLFSGCKPANPFLDLEAQVEEDEEDVDSELEVPAEIFGVDEIEDEEEDVLSQRVLAQAVNETTGNVFWDQVVGRLEAQIHNLGRRILQDSETEDGGPTLPKPSDLLFEIPCTVGKEEALVFKLMTMAFALQDPKTFARSIFARKTMPGRVYVEVPSMERAKAIARIVPDLRGSKIQLVPQDWMTRLLQVAPRPAIKAQTWVRVCKPPKKYKMYQGDIAFVVKVERSRIQICLPQRYEVTEGEEGDALRPRRRLPVLVELDVLKAKLEQLKAKGEVIDHTDQGYLLIDGPVDMVTYGTHIWPIADEFRFFLGCTLLDDHLRANTQAMILKNALRPGDRVKVTAGSLLGLCGTVAELSEDTVDVHIESLDIRETVLLTEIRAYFKEGDLVRVKGGAWKDVVGWVTEVRDLRATVHRNDKHEEDAIALINLEFYEEVEMMQLRPIVPPAVRAFKEARALFERQSMRENPNAKYHGKQVMVTGGHHLKGVRGTIRDTTAAGDAIVEVHLFNLPRQKIPLKMLRIFRGNNLHAMIDGFQRADSETSSSGSSSSGPSRLANYPALTPMQDTMVCPSTPLPVEPSSNEDPAWDPSSATPRTIADADIEPPFWLSDERFMGVRVQLVERGGDPFRRMEFKGIAGDTVTVQDRMQTRSFALTKVIPIVANRKDDILACFAEGDHFGRMFKVKTFGSDKCVVRPLGMKSGKGEKLLTLETSSLVIVYPPTLLDLPSAPVPCSNSIASTPTLSVQASAIFSHPTPYHQPSSVTLQLPPSPHIHTLMVVDTEIASFYFLEDEFGGSSRQTTYGVKKMIERIIIPALDEVEIGLAGVLGPSFRLNDFCFLLCADLRGRPRALEQIIAVDAFDVYDKFCFSIEVLEQGTREKYSVLSNFVVGGNGWGRDVNDSRAIQVILEVVFASSWGFLGFLYVARHFLLNSHR
ncbi:hypothetical protein CVT26_011328 [Gymnopilus dilepis]|uniref:Chromatin elongation factor SPT5 n=1 Tax=Gymnopilus dilepis TaxID=231916 RepID=A0A409WZP8_9AGAR|nr:hypothetical protein CVT26_011328 [Gymnopilus dilepis]